MNTHEYASRYAEFFSALTPSDLQRLADFFDQQAHFKDPFNDVIGIDSISRVFDDMFERTQSPKFTVIEWMVNDDGVAYLRWTFSFTAPMLGSQQFEGISRVVFNDQGKVIEHVDYWNPAEEIYEKIPLLGSLMKVLKNKLKA